MHTGLTINYCSRVFTLTPWVSLQKEVLLCKLFLVLFRAILFSGEWIFFFKLHCKYVQTYLRVGRQCSTVMNPSCSFSNPQPIPSLSFLLPTPQNNKYNFYSCWSISMKFQTSCHFTHKYFFFFLSLEFFICTASKII